VSVNLADPADPVVKAALARKCECGAKPGERCQSITSVPFNRVVHFVRVEQWDVTEAARGNE